MSESDVAHIAGNASPEIKHVVGNVMLSFIGLPSLRSSPYFGRLIQERMKITEVSVVSKSEDPAKLEGRVVIELEVTEDMLNGGGHIHGGCSAFLVDTCSTLALAALAMANTGEVPRSVSQSLSLVYHSPATMGDKLRLVNTTLTIGARAQSARTEIWNASKHRLVVSGTHVKMEPSPPKSRL